jgi:hypothetical protein
MVESWVVDLLSFIGIIGLVWFIDEMFGDLVGRKD